MAPPAMTDSECATGADQYDSKDSEMENSASERASYTSGEIPESEIPQDRTHDSNYTEVPHRGRKQIECIQIGYVH